MHIEASFILSIVSLYDELLKNGVSIVYIGKFNHQITKMFTSLSEEEMMKNSENKAIRKKMYHTLIEVLQNMNKHSAQLSEHYNIGAGLFLIGKQENSYYIITANKIQKSNIKSLTSALNKVNTASKEELNEMFKEQLRSGKISERGGAGLGLIDIARKTGEKIDYKFIPIDKNEEYFILKVEINAAKMSETHEGDLVIVKK